MPALDLQIALVLIALLAGVGITAIGPGGILLTIALYALLPIPPPVIAGTASVTFIAAGLLGCASYLKSGELRLPANRSLAGWLSGTGIVGALAGTLVNPLFPRETFGLLLALATILAGVVVLVQQLWGLHVPARPELGTIRGRGNVAGVGLALGFACALLGVGGPVFAVPALVLLGVPMLASVAVAQVQSVFISAFATAGYAVQGAVHWPLALLVGIPELVGVVLGWWVAQRTKPAQLKLVLGAVLVIVGLSLMG